MRIVSVPILNKLNPEKAASLKNSKLTFTLELGKSIGWADYIGDITDSFSVETFGKSAPEDDLSKFFKLNVESVEQRIRNYLGKLGFIICLPQWFRVLKVSHFLIIEIVL